MTDLRAPGPLRRHHVRTLGRPDGPVLVLLHGFGCDQRIWDPVLPALTAGHRVVLLDLMGSGQSDVGAYCPRRYADLAGHAADVAEVCDELGLRDVVLVGHSVSAMIALHVERQRPGLVRRLVLVAASPCYLDDEATGYVGGFRRTDVEGLLASMDHNLGSDRAAPAVDPSGTGPADPAAEFSARLAALDPEVGRQLARVTFLTDSRALLADVQAPSLLLQASDDPFTPFDVGTYLHQHLPRNTLVRLSAVGHLPHVVEPEATGAAILEHLASAR